MAILNKLNYKGLTLPGVYSRIASVQIDTRGTEPKVTISVADYANEAAAAKVLEDVKRLDPQSYDEKNEEHKRQWLANGGLDAEGNELPVDPTWAPTIYVTESKWLGKRKEDPIQERSVELPLELAIAIITQTVPGANPKESTDNLTSQAYRAAVLTGKFEEALSV